MWATLILTLGAINNQGNINFGIAQIGTPAVHETYPFTAHTSSALDFKYKFSKLHINKIVIYPLNTET